MLDTIRDRNLISESNYEIKSSTIKRFRINNLRLPEGFMVINRDKGTVTITIDYEKRVHIFHNVDAVMSFKEVYEGRELD